MTRQYPHEAGNPRGEGGDGSMERYSICAQRKIIVVAVAM